MSPIGPRLGDHWDNEWVLMGHQTVNFKFKGQFFSGLPHLHNSFLDWYVFIILFPFTVNVLASAVKLHCDNCIPMHCFLALLGPRPTTGYCPSLF